MLLTLVDGLCKELGLDAAQTARVQKLWHDNVERTEGLAFCLSREDDLLSQWRDYANNATGVAIGFSSDYLSRFNSNVHDRDHFCTLERIDYGVEDLRDLLRPVFSEQAKTLKLWRPDPAFTDQVNEDSLSFALFMQMANWGRSLYSFKHPSFSAEVEWRLLSLLSTSEAEHCRYRATATRVIPYRELELLPLAQPPMTSAIVSVMLGPEHRTSIDDIKKFLKRNGIQAPVARSTSTFQH